MSGNGIFTVSLNMPLTGTFGTVTNISTRPTIKLVFPDPTGTMTLADLPDNLSQLEAIQFPSLHLSTTGLSETWSPTVTTFDMGLTNADIPPDSCPSGCKYSFSLSGKIEGIPLSSPLASYNGYSYIASGDFFNNGTLNFEQLQIMPSPVGCGTGCINAEPDPRG